jgi:hypothetical protein
MEVHVVLLRVSKGETILANHKELLTLPTDQIFLQLWIINYREHLQWKYLLRYLQEECGS